MPLLAKRLFDIVLSVLLLCPAVAVILIASAAIAIESPGPPLFWQDRVGRQLRTFRMLKLRTMRQGTEPRPSHEVSKSAITKVGHFLRRTKLDELPQIFSVFRGDMSFVGPRPCLPTQTELIEYRRRMGVFEVKPGITGKAQIAAIDMSTPELLAKTDAEYVSQRTFGMDLAIIIATFLGRGRGDAVR